VRSASERGALLNAVAAAARRLRRNWKIAAALIGIWSYGRSRSRRRDQALHLTAPSVVLASLWRSCDVLAAAGFTVQPC